MFSWILIQYNVQCIDLVMFMCLSFTVGASLGLVSKELSYYMSYASWAQRHQRPRLWMFSMKLIKGPPCSDTARLRRVEPGHTNQPRHVLTEFISIYLNLTILLYVWIGFKMLECNSFCLILSQLTALASLARGSANSSCKVTQQSLETQRWPADFKGEDRRRYSKWAKIQ